MKKKIYNILKKRGIKLAEILNAEIKKVENVDVSDTDIAWDILADIAWDILEEIDDGYTLGDIDTLIGLGENERWFDYFFEDVMNALIIHCEKQ